MFSVCTYCWKFACYLPAYVGFPSSEEENRINLYYLVQIVVYFPLIQRKYSS